jgi:predicted molibdopterin-dependent oxidoreductase YjgC
MDLIVVLVDGRPVEAPEGSNLLDALQASGIRIPRLCHDARVAPTGSCGLCVVSRRDRDGELVLACESRVEAGMEVDTSTPAVAAERARRLAALLPTHALECPTCERHGDCRLEDLVHLMGAIDEGPVPLLPRPPREDSWPLIVHDPARCVACGLCERLCAEAMGVGAITLVRTDSGSRVVTVSGDALSCEFCGQCVDACPVAALAARPDAMGVPAWQREVTSTTCSGCSCGCRLGVESLDGRLIRIRGSEGCDPDGGNLCIRGRYAWDLLRSPGRLVSPLMRRGGRLVETSWEEALAATAQALRAVRAQRQNVAAIGSTRLTDEDAYVLQRFMRSVVGSPHVDAGPDAGIRALVDGMGAVVGVPASTASFGDVSAADLVLVLRGDVGRSHPMIKNLLVQRVARGRRVLEAFATAGGVAGRRAGHLRVAPGGEEALLLWLARDALRRRAGVPEDGANRTGFAEWCTALEAIGEANLGAETGVGQDALREIGDALAASASLVIVVVTGRGIPGDEAAVARRACELLAVLGRAGRPGNGVLVLGAKTNAQGVVAAGLHPRMLPGFRDATAAGDRASCALRWGCSVAAGPGWSHREAMLRAAAGEVGLLFLAGQDPVGTWPRGLKARDGVEGARFVVVLDSFLTETARLADVVLPVATGLEREGRVTSADGVRRLLRRGVRPPGDLPSDRQVLVELARRLGVRIPLGEPLATELEKELPPAPAPCGGVIYSPVEPVMPAGPARGLLLDAAPRLVHASSMTRHSATLLGLRPLVNVRLSTHDARALGLEDGETARVVAGSREVLRRVVVDPSVPRGIAVSGWYGVGGGAGALYVDDALPVFVEIRKSP